MVLDKHIPDSVTESVVREIYENRFPNYCPECGGEMVVAGGRLEPEQGIYEHIDPVIMCGDNGCKEYRFTAGIYQEKGQEEWIAPGADNEQNELLFGGYTGYCDIHNKEMTPTKDLRIDGKPARQYKCPTCDREAVIMAKESLLD